MIILHKTNISLTKFHLRATIHKMGTHTNQWWMCPFASCYWHNTTIHT